MKIVSRRRSDDVAPDGGFTLIETLVSVTLLAIVAGGATTGIVSGTRAQNGTQDRVVATNLAGADLDRARSVPFPNYPTAARSTPTVGGTTFTVTRTVRAYTATAVATAGAGCPAQVTATDVLQLVVTTAVTWNRGGPGVSMSTVVAC